MTINLSLTTHRILLVLFMVLALSLLSSAQTIASPALTPPPLPDAPVIQSAPQQFTFEMAPAATSTMSAPAPKPKPKSVFSPTSPTFWAIASFSTTVLDVESTRHAIDSCGLREVNPVYGSNPSRAKLYAINLPITVGSNLLAAYLRHRKPDSKLWMLLPGSITATHSIGAANNLYRCH